MRPQWRNGQTHHHQKGWRSQFCRCCTMFGPSNYRKRGDYIFTNIGRIRAFNRSYDFEKDFLLQKMTYEKTTMKWKSRWNFSRRCP